MPPAILVDIGLETIRHSRRLAVCGLIAKRARHAGGATTAAVRTFPGPSGMLLAHPTAIVAACADGHAKADREFILGAANRAS